MLARAAKEMTRLLAAARADRRGLRRRLVPDRRRRRVRATGCCASPTARRTSSSPAARTCPRCRSRLACSSTRTSSTRRSSRSRTSAGARRPRRSSSCATARRSIREALIGFCRARLAHFECSDLSRAARLAAADRDREGPEVPSARAVLAVTTADAGAQQTCCALTRTRHPPGAHVFREAGWCGPHWVCLNSIHSPFGPSKKQALVGIASPPSFGVIVPSWGSRMTFMPSAVSLM